MAVDPRRVASKSTAILASALALSCLAACSSSGSSGSSGSSSSGESSGSSPTFTGAPITVQINTAIGTPFGSYPGSIAAVKAMARTVNSAGGINGHKVAVESCNTQLNPNQELACARKAVSNGAVVTLSSLILTSGTDYLSILNKAGIADVGSEVIQDVFAQAPNSYPIEFDPGAFAPCTGGSIVKAVGGKKVVAVYPDVPASAPLRKYIELGTQRQGGTYAGSVPVGATVTDYAPIVQKISSLKPNITVQIAGPAQVAALLQQTTLTGRKLTICSPVASNISPALAAAGSAASSFYLAQAMPPLSAIDQIPALKTFKSEMAAELASGDKDADISGTKGGDPNELQTWLAAQVFAQVAKSVKGTVTAASFQAALKTAKFDGMGIIPNIEFATPQTAGTFTRIFNPQFSLQKWNVKAKQFDLVPNSEIDTAKVLFG